MPLGKHIMPECLNRVFALRRDITRARAVVADLTLLSCYLCAPLRSMGDDMDMLSGVVGAAGGVPALAKGVR